MQIILLLSYALVISPGCRQRDSANSEVKVSESDRQVARDLNKVLEKTGNKDNFGKVLDKFNQSSDKFVFYGVRKNRQMLTLNYTNLSISNLVRNVKANSLDGEAYDSFLFTSKDPSIKTAIRIRGAHKDSKFRLFLEEIDISSIKGLSANSASQPMYQGARKRSGTFMTINIDKEEEDLDKIRRQISAEILQVKSFLDRVGTKMQARSFGLSESDEKAAVFTFIAIGLALFAITLWGTGKMSPGASAWSGVVIGVLAFVVFMTVKILDEYL